MKSRAVYYATVLAGVICGMLSTSPLRLRFVPSLLLWGGVGALMGLFAQNRRGAVRLGLVYGVSLLAGFFAAQVEANTKAIHSPVFIALATVLTPIGAVVSVFGGSMVRQLSRRKTP